MIKDKKGNLHIGTTKEFREQITLIDKMNESESSVGLDKADIGTRSAKNRGITILDVQEADKVLDESMNKEKKFEIASEYLERIELITDGGCSWERLGDYNNIDEDKIVYLDHQFINKDDEEALELNLRRLLKIQNKILMIGIECKPSDIIPDKNSDIIDKKALTEAYNDMEESEYKKAGYVKRDKLVNKIRLEMDLVAIEHASAEIDKDEVKKGISSFEARTKYKILYKVLELLEIDEE